MKAADILSSLGLKQPEVLLPGPGVAYEPWAVVACDQFTAQPDYWQEVERRVDGLPSALHITLPEIYLGQADQRTPLINQTMAAYLNAGVLAQACEGFVLVQRETSGGTRHGLMVLVDLDQYDYALGAQSRIRATEGTILDRIPPRVAIRRDAPVELPHVLLLIDDPEKSVIEPLAAQKHSLRKLYDFDLMQGGGHIEGYAIEDEGLVAQIAHALTRLDDTAVQQLKYGLKQPEAPFTFAVGDGNHSLATAKAVWEEKKKGLPLRDQAAHPARFALVELNNLHDGSLVFEPIHRVLFGVNPDDLLAQLHAWARKLPTGSFPAQSIVMMAQGAAHEAAVPHPPHPLAVGSLQQFLDGYLAAHPQAQIDYIHGDDALSALCQRPDAAGFLLPGMGKNQLFESILKGGPLPRKTFSMGHAQDKRYYLEARRIAPPEEMR